MKIKYGLGKGPWAESAVVGLVASVTVLILTPFMILLSVVIFFAGLFGFLKRKEE